MSRDKLMMEQLAARLENDARNELHSVMGMLTLIAEGPLTGRQYDYLRACRSSADRLLRTVQNVFEFLAPESEEAQIHVFDLQEAVASLTNFVRTMAHRKGLGFTYEDHLGGARWVAGNRERIQDILFRLLENAVQFTDRGEVRLIATDSSQDSTGLRVKFDVCDTGPGISAETIAWVLKPSWENLERVGLGLPIARKLALAMGGDLSIEARESGGARVTVSLSLAPASAIPGVIAPSLVDAHSRAQAPLSILVAEDSDDSYFVIESYLEDQPYLLTRASDGTGVVELFKKGHFDLVLMDVHMPAQDGYAATRAIRQWETTAARTRVPIVILSSDSPRVQIENGARVGCSGYLTKPVSKADILGVLQRYAGASTEYWIP